MTLGAVVSGPSPVEKVQTKSAARGLPFRSVAPVVMVAVNVVFGARSAVGVKVAVLARGA